MHGRVCRTRRAPKVSGSCWRVSPGISLRGQNGDQVTGGNWLRQGGRSTAGHAHLAPAERGAVPGDDLALVKWKFQRCGELDGTIEDLADRTTMSPSFVA